MQEEKALVNTMANNPKHKTKQDSETEPELNMKQIMAMA